MNFTDIFTSDDGKSSILDKAESVFEVASYFFPQAILLKTIVGAIDSIVDPDNKEDKITNYDVIGILSTAIPSVGNILTAEKLSKISTALDVADFAVEKFAPSSKVQKVIADMNEIVNNSTDSISNEDIIGIVSKAGLSKHNTIDVGTIKIVKDILS